MMGERVCRYRASGPCERRRIQAEVVEAHSASIKSVVRRMLNGKPNYWPEACQVGAIGLLAALEKYDDAIAGPDRGKKFFWAFALPYVRDEIRKWIGIGVYWRPVTRKRRPGFDAAGARAQGRFQSMEVADPNGQGLVSLYESTPCDQPDVETAMAEAEVKARLRLFASSLSEDERAVLFSTDGRLLRSRRHLILVERARAFVERTR